jgi:methylenetetrahydrofolate reductase (NADPH)
MQDVAGIHLMASGWEERAPETIEAAGLLPRPKVEAD